MDDNKFIRVEEDDPERCQTITRTGQCNLKSVSGGKNCLLHGGAMILKNQELKNLKNYRLAKFRSRASELGNSKHLSSLTDEVAILRILIEEMVNACDDTSELLLRAGPLADLLMKAERLVMSCTKLDVRLGNHLTKDQILQFAQLVVEIVSDEITDEHVLDSISSKILKAFEEI